MRSDRLGGRSQSRRLRLSVLVLVPITAGVTSALLLDSLTDNGPSGFWVGSAVTLATTTILRRAQRRS